MTNYRDRFQNRDSKSLDTKESTERVLIPKNEDDYTSDAESQRFVKAYYKQKSRYIPEIDYKDPATFAFFGSSEKYYEDSINNVYSTYPYDGSKAEKMEWSLSASYLDLYLLEHEYPKAAGSLNLNRSTVTGGTPSSGADENPYFTAQTPRYIKFFGGPQKNTIYNASKNRESNIKIDGTTGNTVEFWLKKDNSSWLGQHTREVVLDINSADTATDSSNFGRMTVELKSPSNAASSPFYFTYKSGSIGTSTPNNTNRGLNLGDATITKATVADGKWHHYAITTIASGSNTIYKFYVDGTINHTVSQNHVVGPVNTFLSGTIGASTSNGASSTVGRGQLSASLDEVRIWKTARTEKEIGRFWYNPVHGGTDNDHTNANLGVYYKFNEGIIGTEDADKVVLDYSGRINNGAIVNWDSSLRSLDSAITLSEEVPEEDYIEYGDPIINSENTRVKVLKTDLEKRGRSHDVGNLASLRNSVPQHFTDTDTSEFLDLLQILSSAFDDLFIKIKNLPKMKDFSYQEFFEEKGSYKQAQDNNFLVGCEDVFLKEFTGHHAKPWVSNILENFGMVSADIFQDATMFERFFNRTEEVSFEHDLEEVKRLVLSNIHKNLVHILKTKGTESSFRNLIRCFGVDDEIVKLNAYGDNEVYELITKPIYTTIKQKSLNFEGQNSQGVIHNALSGSNLDAASFITGSSTITPLTMEGNFIFPKYNQNKSVAMTNSSLFGIHSISDTAQTNASLTFRGTDNASLQARTVKRSFDSPDAYFELSSSSGIISSISSSYIPDVYDNQHWNVSVRVGTKEGIDFNISAPSEYFIEFTGYNYDLDVLKNSFHVSASISAAAYNKISLQNKAIYAGAHRTNFSGSLLESTDVRLLGFNTWRDILTEEELKEHAQNSRVFGRKKPQSISNFDTGDNLSSLDSLAFRWQFDAHTSSSGAGTLTVLDMSSGSAASGIGPQYTGLASGFSNSSEAIAQEFIPGVEYFGPDSSYSSDRVKIKNTELDKFKADSKPVTYNFSFEKSMYQVISREMVNFFAGIVGFSNIIGEPVNKYRRKYKLLEKIRSKFFMRVNNEPDIEKFIEYYKWIDSSLSKFLSQLIPASSFLSADIKDVVESHVLERNKYEHKAPTVEFKDPSEKIYPILGINELLYDWEHGHAQSTFQQLVNEKSILFDGANDHVLIADNDVFSFTDGAGNDEPFSISAWVYVDDVSSDNGPFVTKAKVSGGAHGLEYIFKHAAGVLQVFLYTSPGTSNRLRLDTNSSVLTDQTWHHVVMTYTGSNEHSGLALYVDGVHITATTGVENGNYAGMINQTTPLILGKTNNDLVASPNANQAFEDRMADVCIFDKSLSALEAAEVYNSGKVKDMAKFTANSNIISWWKMGDDRDTTANTGIIDYKGIHNGTLKDGASIVDESLTDLPSETETVIRGWDESRPQDQNCLWLKERSEVSTDREVIKRISHTEVSGSTYVTRRLVKPYRLTGDNVVTNKAGFNRDANKNTELYKVINSATGQNITLKGSALGLDPECSDRIDPTKKKMYKGKTDVTGTTGYLDGDSDLILPFNLVSSSAGTDLPGLKDNVRVANNHLDLDITGEKSLRGPFGETHIGGMPHNKVRFGTANSERPEAYSLNVNTGTKTLTVDPTPINAPKSMYFRGVSGTRFANVSNIRHDTSSLVLGNYNKDYEIVMTSGRSTNNDHFVDNEGSWVGVFTAPQDGGLTDIVNYSVPDRGRTDHVIVNRFSAPGSPESQGSFAMDSESEEFSIYNTINYRNLLVRDTLNRLHAEHSDQFGVRRGSTATATVTITSRANLTVGNKVSFKLNDGTTITATANGSSTTTNNTNTPTFSIAGSLSNDATATNLANCLNANSRLIASATSNVVTITQTLPIPGGNLIDVLDHSNHLGTITLTDAAPTGMSKTDFVINSRTQASLHMTNRNFTRLTGALGQEVEPDSFFVQRPIPTHDFSYSWIAASANEDVYSFLNKNENYGHQHTMGRVSGSMKSSQTISFLGSSQLVPNLDFVHGNFYATASLNNATNTVTYTGTELNSQILNIQGPYGWPTWKQLRGSEHPVSRYERKNAKISLVTGKNANTERTYLFPGTIKRYEWSTNKNLYSVDLGGTAVVEKKIEVFDEIMATNRFNPLTITFHGAQANDLTTRSISQPMLEQYWNNDETSLVALQDQAAILSSFPAIQTRLASLKISAANEESTFANYDLTERLGIEDVRLPKTVSDMLSELGNLIIEEEDIFATEINYIETLYPREVNTFTKESRIRENFDFYSWRDTRPERAITLTGSIVNHVGSQTNVGILANRDGASFNFDGSNDYVQIADNPSLTPLTASITNVAVRNFTGTNSRATVSDHDDFTFVAATNTNVAVSTFDQSPSAEHFQVADNDALSFSQANDSNLNVRSFSTNTKTHIAASDTINHSFVAQSTARPVTELVFNGSSSKIILDANANHSFATETTIAGTRNHANFDDATAKAFNVSDNDVYSYVATSGPSTNTRHLHFQGYSSSTNRGLLLAAPSSVTGNSKGFSMVNQNGTYEDDYSIGFYIKPNDVTGYGNAAGASSLSRVIMSKLISPSGIPSTRSISSFEWMIHQHNRSLVLEQRCGTTGQEVRYIATNILDSSAGATAAWQHIGITYDRFPNYDSMAEQSVTISSTGTASSLNGNSHLFRVRKQVSNDEYFKIKFDSSTSSHTYSTTGASGDFKGTLTVGTSGQNGTISASSNGIAGALVAAVIEHKATMGARFEASASSAVVKFEMDDRGSMTGIQGDNNGADLLIRDALDGSSAFGNRTNFGTFIDGKFPEVKFYKNGALAFTLTKPSAHSDTDYRFVKMTADSSAGGVFVIGNGPLMGTGNSWSGYLSSICMWKHGAPTTVTVGGVDFKQTGSVLGSHSWKRIYNGGFLFDYTEELTNSSIVAFYKLDTNSDVQPDATSRSNNLAPFNGSSDTQVDQFIGSQTEHYIKTKPKQLKSFTKAFWIRPHDNSNSDIRAIASKKHEWMIYQLGQKIILRIYDSKLYKSDQTGFRFVDFESANFLSSNNWDHVAIHVFYTDPGSNPRINVKFYVNGSLNQSSYVQSSGSPQNATEYGDGLASLRPANIGNSIRIGTPKSDPETGSGNDTSPRKSFDGDLSNLLFFAETDRTSEWAAGLFTELYGVSGISGDHTYDYRRHTKAGTMTAYWKLDASSGATSTNIMGNGNATVVSGETPAIAQTALLPEKDFRDVDFSILAWVKPDSNGAGAIISKEDKDSSAAKVREWEFVKTSANKVRINLFDSDPITTNDQPGATAFFVKSFQSTSTLTVNQWNHVAVVYDASSGAAQIYINNSLSSLDDLSSETNFTNLLSPQEYVSTRPTATNVHIGCTKNAGSTNSHFAGRIHNLAIFRAFKLTGTHVGELYNSGKAWEIKQHSTYSDMLSYFKLDSVSPSDVKSASTVDSSSNLSVITPGSPSSATLDTVQDEDRSFTLAFWMKKDSKTDTGKEILGKWDGSTANQEYRLTQEGRGLKLELRDTTGTDNTSTLSAFTETNILSNDTGAWEHITVTYTQSTRKVHFYRNASVGTGAGQTGTNSGDYFEMQNTTSEFVLGSSHVGGTDSASFRGDISNLLLFKHAELQAPLTSTQVTELYNGGFIFDYKRHSKAADIVLWWKLEDATGTSHADSSGLSHTGTSNTSLAQTTASPVLQRRVYADQPFTVSFWAKATNLGALGIIISKQDAMDSSFSTFEDLGEWAITAAASSGNLALRLIDPVGPAAVPVLKTYTFAAGITTSAWKFITVVYDPSASDKAVMYHGTHTISSLSSAVVGSAGGSSDYVAMRNSAYVTRIGGTPDASGGGTSLNGYKGHLSNLIVYKNDALSSSEATALFNAGYPHDFRELSTYSNASAYWKLDHTSNGNAIDIKNGLTGTRTGVTQTAAGASNLAKREDVDIPFSFGMWVKKTSFNSAADYLVSKYSTSDNQEYTLSVSNSGAVDLVLRDTSGLSAGTGQSGTLSVAGVFHTTNDLNQWRHIVVTYNPSTTTMTVYKNGSSSGLTPDSTISSANYSEMQNTTAAFTIGAPASIATTTDGHLSNVVMFRNHVLTAGEAVELYNDGYVYNYTTHSQASNIKAWWKLDETGTSSGVTFADSSASSHTATANGTTVGVIAAASSGRQHREFLTTPITITAWINPDTISGNGAIVSKYATAPNREYRFVLQNKKLYLYLSDDGNAEHHFVTGDVIPTADTWYHVAVTFTPDATQADGGDAIFYVDGVAHADSTNNPASGFGHPVNDTTAAFRIGLDASNGQPFDGNIANVLLWMHQPSVAPLTATQIQTIKGLGFCYDDASIPRKGEAVVYLKLNEGDSISGAVVNHASGNLPGTAAVTALDANSSPDKLAYFYKTEQANKFDYRASNGHGIDFVDVDSASPLKATATFITASRWPLDARATFAATPLNLTTSSFNSTEAGNCFTYAPTSQGTRGEGTLQNDYSIFGAGANFQHGAPAVGPVYSRRVPQVYKDPANVVNEYLAGEAEWKVGAQLGVNPFDTDFEKHATNFRQVGQDHSLVPEFIVSDHVEDIILNGDGDFSEVSNREAFLSVTGALYHTSSQELQVSEKFYKTYGISDMMKYFGVTLDHVEDNNLGDPKKLTLRCKAALKFTPYRGFYPVERVQQITELFTRGYMPEFDFETTETKPAFVVDQEILLKTKIRANLQQSIKPLFAPGILMNSIKSGMAVDYPLFTADNTAVQSTSGSNGEGYESIDITTVETVDIKALTSFGNYLAASDTIATGSSGGKSVGRVYFYEKSIDNTGKQQHALVHTIDNPSLADPTQISGSIYSLNFGSSMDMMESIIAIGMDLSDTDIQLDNSNNKLIGSNIPNSTGSIFLYGITGSAGSGFTSNLASTIVNPDDPRHNCDPWMGTTNGNCTISTGTPINSRGFGSHVVISPKYLFTSALINLHNDGPDDYGRVYVYKAGYQGGSAIHRVSNWENINGVTDIFQRIDAPLVADNSVNDYFANYNSPSFDFAENTDTLVVGSPIPLLASTNALGGYVYTYEASAESGEFSLKQTISPPAQYRRNGSKFGSTVSITKDGQTLVVGQAASAIFSDEGSALQSAGTIHIYQSQSSGFVHSQTLTHPNPSTEIAFSHFGKHAQISGSYLICNTTAGTAAANNRSFLFKKDNLNKWVLFSELAQDLSSSRTNRYLATTGIIKDDNIYLGSHRPSVSNTNTRTIFSARLFPDAVDNYDSIKRNISSPSKEFSPELKSINNFTGSLVNDTKDTGAPRLSGNVYKRVTFEEMMNPDSLKGVSIEDQEPHPSASIYHADKYTGKVMDFPFKFGELDATNNEIDLGVSSFSLKKGLSDTMKPYRLAINNFCAETINFFLKDGKTSTLETRGVVNPRLVASEEYKMRVEVVNNGTRMYDRHSAFGPAVDEGTVTLLSDGVETKFTNKHAHSPFVPPFLDTDSNPYVDITFTPSESREYTLEEIIDASEYKYVNFSTAPSNASDNTNYINAMSLSASLKLDGLVVYESDSPDQGTTLSQRSRWVIQPRWETPVLNFIDATTSALRLDTNVVEERSSRNGLPWQKRGWKNFYVSNPSSSAVPYLTSSTGMWHQAGTLPTSQEEGYTLRIQPHPDVVKPRQQLADRVGFTNSDATTSQVGRLRDKKVVYEAVIAIPFIEPKQAEGSLSYFDIDKMALRRAAEMNSRMQQSTTVALGSMNPNSEEYLSEVSSRELIYNTPGQSPEDAAAYILRMYEKFIIPEEFKEKMMYVFQFSAEFTKQDLANIWQNVSPTSDFSAKDLRYSTVDNSQGISGGSQDVQYISNFLGDLRPTRDPMDFKNDKIRWIVLKVKQRAEFDINNIKRKSLRGSRLGMPIDESAGTFNQTPELEDQKFSFNWPYDFFSIVELVKLEGKVDIFNGASPIAYNPDEEE